MHLRDLALRAAHLIGATELPNTAGHHWEDMDSTTRLLAEGHVVTALALARFFHQLSRQPRLLADADTAPAALAPLIGVADPSRLAAWRARWSGKSPTPALLTVALATVDWMAAGVSDHPSPLAALAAGAVLLAAAGTLRTIPLPLWGAAPALATGDPDGLPRLRSNAASRASPAGPPAGRGPSWPWSPRRPVAAFKSSIGCTPLPRPAPP